MEICMIINIKDGRTSFADIEKLKNNGLPLNYLDVDSMTTDLWLELVENLKRELGRRDANGYRPGTKVNVQL